GLDDHSQRQVQQVDRPAQVTYRVHTYDAGSAVQAGAEEQLRGFEGGLYVEVDFGAVQAYHVGVGVRIGVVGVGGGGVGFAPAAQAVGDDRVVHDVGEAGAADQEFGFGLCGGARHQPFRRALRGGVDVGGVGPQRLAGGGAHDVPRTGLLRRFED